MSKNVTIVGSGRPYGSAMSDYWHLNHENRISCENILDDTGAVLQQIEESRSRIFIVCLALGKHASEIGKTVYQRIFEQDGIAVCIDSVQSKANEVLGTVAKESESGGLLCVHPNYGVKNLHDNIPGSNIVTGIYGSQEERIAAFMQRVMPNDLQRFSWVDISNESVALSDGKTLVGAELHDWALAYTQTLVHMLRLASLEEEFHTHFPNMKVPRDFSERLIQANPQAMELQTEHFSEIDHELFQAMEKAKILIAYISSILGEKPYFDHLKTPNFRMLEEMCKK
jgi:hypothetical protein